MMEKAESFDLRERLGRALLLACLGIILAASVRSGLIYVSLHPWAWMFDFQAFYCAGTIVAGHFNPYFTEPLHLCEAAVNPAFHAVMPNVTIPAPLPPYALLLLRPFSLLPWHAASMVWTGVLFTCIVGSAFLTSKLSRVPFLVTLVGMFCAMVFPSIIAGALAPIPIALWLVAALWARQKRWTLTAIVLGLSMIEPHVALPVCIATFLGIPALRLRLIGMGTLLLALQLAFTPVSLIGDYIALLHIHSAAEVSNSAQHSLTFFLHNLGMSAGPAIQLGFLQYALFCGIGIFGGITLLRRYADGAWLILVPAALAVVGGPFVHLTEIVIAIPLCFMLWKRGVQLAGVALVLLATPWFAVNEQWLYIPWTVLTTGVLVYYLWKPRFAILIGSVVGAGMTLMCLSPSSYMPIATARSIVFGLPKMTPVAGNTYASVSWATYNNLFLPSPYWIISHLPTWFALLAMSISVGSLLLARGTITTEQPSPRAFYPRLFTGVQEQTSGVK